MSDPQDLAEQLDEDVTDLGVPIEDDVAIQGEVADLSELMLDGDDVIDTGVPQSPEEAAVHVIDSPET